MAYLGTVSRPFSRRSATTRSSFGGVAQQSPRLETSRASLLQITTGEYYRACIHGQSSKCLGFGGALSFCNVVFTRDQHYLPFPPDDWKPLRYYIIPTYRFTSASQSSANGNRTGPIARFISSCRQSTASTIWAKTLSSSSATGFRSGALNTARAKLGR